MYIDNLTACGILVPQPGIRQTPSATEVWGPNHWTAREFHIVYIYFFCFFFLLMLSSIMLSKNENGPALA